MSQTRNIIIEEGERLVLPDWVDDIEWIYERTRHPKGGFDNHITHVPTNLHAHGNTTDSAFDGANRLRKMIEEYRKTAAPNRQ
jgi:hypothetical protein